MLKGRASRDFRKFSLVKKNYTWAQGWAMRSFPFGTFRSFSFLKKNVPFFSVLFSSFWRLMRPKRMFRSFPFFFKERKRMQRSFAKNRKERNFLLQRMEKNARTFPSFAKERENLLFFFQYIYRYI